MLLFGGVATTLSLAAHAQQSSAHPARLVGIIKDRAIDDYIKDGAEANSQTARDKTWDWFTDRRQLPPCVIARH